MKKVQRKHLDMYVKMAEDTNQTYTEQHQKRYIQKRRGQQSIMEQTVLEVVALHLMNIMRQVTDRLSWLMIKMMMRLKATRR